jgi:hypothetical protein
MQPSLVAVASESDVRELHSLTAIYTSSPVVEALLDRLDWPARAGRLLDPSSGDGAFLIAALARLDTPPHSATTDRVRGWEIYPEAVRESRQRIVALLQQRGWSLAAARRASERIVRQADFLADPMPSSTFTVLAGNPPYLRFANLPTAFKGLYSITLPVHARGDLLHGFLDRCCAILATDGVIGFVTADRWLFNETAAGLRETLGKRLGLSHVERLDPRSSFYRPKMRSVGTPPRIHPVVVVLSNAARGRGPITRLPLSPDGVEHRPGLRSLADVASVRLAPWLGPMGIFVVDAAAAAAFPRECLVPAVDTDDLDEHDLLAAPTRFAIVTADADPGGAVSEHLRQQQARMPARGKRVRFWLPPERITLDLTQPGLLVPRIARRLRVIDLPAGVLPINHNLHVVASTSGGLPLNELRELLLSPSTQAWISANAPRLESGFLSITTKLLRRMPV